MLKSKTTTAIVALALILSLGACSTGRGTGALAGGGVGAIVGGAAGGWQWAAIGAAAGAAGGYIIGNESDQANARRYSDVPASELKPLAGTKWRLVSAEGDNTGKGQIGTVYHFGQKGGIKAYDPGVAAPREAAEWFRLAGGILIIYSNDYVYNFDYSVNGDVLNVKGKGADAKLMNLTLSRVQDS